MKSLFTFLLIMMTVSVSFSIPQIGFTQDEVSLEVIQADQSIIEVEQKTPSVTSEVKAEIPEGDPIASLVKLITDWKSMSPIALGIALVILLVQISKAGWIESLFKLFGWSHVLEWKRAIVTISGVVYGVLYLINTGSHWLSALAVAVLSSGGAVAIYEAIKPLFPNKKKTEVIV